MNRWRRETERPSRPTARGFRLCLLLGVLAAGCDFPGRPHPGNRPISPEKVVDFHTLFTQNCAGCHGADGKLGPAPPLNDPIFLAIIPDEALLHVISEGRFGTPMPPFAKDSGGPLSDVQIKALAAGIKAQWSPGAPPQRKPPRYSAAQSDAGDKKRGALVFARACAPCHGEHGEGGDSDEEGAGALNDPSFLALISDQALRRIAITGRPDLNMPDYADKSMRGDDYQPMSSQDIDDLVAFLASWRRSDRPAPGEASSSANGPLRPDRRGRSTTTALSLGP